MEAILLTLELLNLVAVWAFYLEFRRIVKDAQVREAITRKFIQTIRIKIQEAKKEKMK